MYADQLMSFRTIQIGEELLISYNVASHKITEQLASPSPDLSDFSAQGNPKDATQASSVAAASSSDSAARKSKDATRASSVAAATSSDSAACKSKGMQATRDLTSTFMCQCSTTCVGMLPLN